MKNLLIGLTLASTCLASTLGLAGSLGGAAIENHKKNVEAHKTDITPRNNTASKPSTGSLSNSAISKHEATVDAEPSLRSNTAPQATSYDQSKDLSNNASLGRAAITKHEKVTGDQ